MSFPGNQFFQMERVVIILIGQSVRKKNHDDLAKNVSDAGNQVSNSKSMGLTLSQTSFWLNYVSAVESTRLLKTLEKG